MNPLLQEFERERQAHSVLQFQFKEMKETLTQTEELLTEVSDLRVKSSSYCQEVSDLQEVLQWKEKKMVALERQREISDVVRRERDRLRDEVVALRDLLKQHGVVVFPEFSTNGEIRQGEDDVSAESAARLDEEPSPGSRESALGKVGEQQPAEGSKLQQDDRKHNGCYKHSQSLNAISTGDQTKPDPLHPVKKLDKQASGRRGGTEKLAARNEGARKIPRKGSEKEPSKKFQTRQDGNPLFRNEGIKKQQMRNEQGTELTEDPAFKGRTKPHSDSGLKSNQDRSFHDQICIIQTIHGGAQTESQATSVDLVSPVCSVSAEKVSKSRLVPPRPAKDIILDNKAMVSGIMAAEKQRDVAQNCLSAVAPISEDQKKDGKSCRGVHCSEGKEVPDIPALCANQNEINEFSAPTSGDRRKENEFVDKMAEIDGKGCDRQSFENKATKVLTDLVENFVMLGQTSQSLVDHQRTISENLGGTLSKDKASENQGNLGCSGLSEGSSFEAKLKLSELNVFLPAEEAAIGETSGTPEKPVGEAVKIQEKTESNSSERPECNNQTETATLSPFDPVQMWKDGSGLENTIQSMLRAFVENQGFAAETSRMFPDVPEPLNQWIKCIEETLKNIAGNVSDQCDTVNQDSTVQMTGIKVTEEGELPLNELPGGKKTPEDPESDVGQSALINDFLVSSLEELTQTIDVSRDSRKVCEAGDNLEATENTSEVMFGVCKFKVEVTESSPEENPGANSAKVEESQSGPMVTSCCEEFVFVESYFAEPAKTQTVECLLEVVDKTDDQREIVHRSQSCLLVSVEEVVEMQLKRHRTLSTNNHVGQSSKVRRLLEITAKEIKAMAVPELVLMSLQEGRIFEDRQIDESTGSNADKELSVGDMDSCEEVGEEAGQHPATQQQRQPVTEVVVEDVKFVPEASGVKPLRGGKGLRLDSRKDEHKTDCKIS
ncbi:uncharacterized protein lrrfip1b isoform X1 [Dicentrarchus labrax]|uniref:uncharacterized protein lrrfip1b isoform X1 n=1 Tax=Dicentrarchus labrax TaxID=13489 RepID=UPI0021F5CE53|nr:uncharacterized protein lrrfip1b isoform X1 [Dicentrarchus labrax]